VAKMMYGVFTMIEDGQVPAGTAVVALVTGGDDCSARSDTFTGPARRPV